jgi:putative ABC transport system permease protein
MLTATLAGLRARWTRLVMSGLAVALGVAFAAGTLIYTSTVNAVYYEQFAAQSRNVSAALEPAQGKLLPMPDLAAVRAVPGVAAAEGRLSGSLPLIGVNGRAYAGIAVDLPASPEFRSWKVLAGGGSVLLDQDTAALDHVRAGTAITVLDHGNHVRRLTVTGIVDTGISAEGTGGSVLILPAATVRALTGTTGYQRIDVAAAPGVSQQALTARLARLRLPGSAAMTGSQLAIQLADQTSGGQSVLSTGLLIFSLVSLIVAALVIYNSFRILLAQRLLETALLRCIGATRRQVMAGILAESLAVGLVASVTGTLLAAAAVAALNSGQVTLSAKTVLASLAVGTVVTAAAAVLPAAAASRIAPAAAMQTVPEGRVRGRIPRIAGSLVLAAAGLALTKTGIPDGKTGLVEIAGGGTLVFLGFLVSGPLIAAPLATALGWLPGRILGVRMRLATTGARRNPARTATTTVALTIGIGLMTLFSVVLSTAGQFAVRELSRDYPADYLLTARGGIPAPVETSLRASSRIAEAGGIRQVTVPVNGHQLSVIAVEPSAYHSVFKPFVTTGSFSRLATGTGGLALSAPVARDLHVAAGSTVRAGGKSFTVTATFAGGIVQQDAVISWGDFSRVFGPGDDSAILVKAKAGVSLTQSAAVVDDAVARYPLIDVTSEASLRQHVISSVSKLTGLLDGLLAVSLVIALFGMASALSLSVLERTRESALLRALGLTRSGLRLMITMEAALLGLMGAVAGVAFGAGFGWATGRAFLRSNGGPVSYPVLQIVALIAVAAAAALLASVVPARRAARLPVTAGLAAQ